MTTPAGTLSDLATVVLLLRDHPDRKEDQRLAFKRFVASLPDADHLLRVTRAGLAWDRVEVPAEMGDLAALREQFRAHGVGEIRFPVGLMTSTVLSLVRILSAPPGTYGSFDHLTARLDASGCGVIPVAPLGPAGEPPAAPVAAPETPSTASPSSTAAPPTAGGSRRPQVEDDGHINALGPDALTEAKVGMMHFATLRTQQLSPADELVGRLANAPSGAASAEALAQLLAAGELAARRAEWAELLKTAHALIELEQKSEGGEPRGYGIAIRKLLPRSVLERIARLAAHGQTKAEAVVVLRRMGADGTEVLLNALVNSEDAAERRAYFSALREMTEGSELLVHMLSHDQWFVVRNVAELCGELRLESATQALAKQVGHDDERVRRAVAGALAKIGGPGSLEPLRRALRDSAPAVRLHAAQGLDGRYNRGLAMSLAVAAEAEGKPDVQREMYLALGRIGSSDAIQALGKAAEPGGRLFRRRPVAVRIAAVEGLHAAGPSAANALKTLLADDNRQVRQAVERALQTLWE